MLSPFTRTEEPIGDTGLVIVTKKSRYSCLSDQWTIEFNETINSVINGLKVIFDSEAKA